MQFVYPAFLFGLAAMAIPLVIHLFNFRRFKTIYFTNVRFLRQVQEETATKNKLKHLLVLISRMLAVAFLVLAFAQPFIPASDVQDTHTSGAVSIYMDNSFSMEAELNDERLLDIAKRKAEEIVEGYTVDDEFQLLTNDMEAKHQRLVSKDEMIRLIAEVQISPVVRPIQDIVERQQDVLNRARNQAKKNIYLLSDFQKNAGTFVPDTAWQYQLVPLQQQSQRNVSVDSVWFANPVPLLNQPIQVCFRLRNYSDDDMENVPVNLKLNEQTKALADVSIPAMGMAVDTLTCTVSEPGWYTGELTIKDYPVTFDDVLYFSFLPVDIIPVMVINGAEENPFIKSVFGNNQSFQLVQNASNQIAFSELNKYDLIILNELPSLSGGLADALREQLSRGANVCIIPSMQMEPGSYNNFLQQFNATQFGNSVQKQRAVTTINIAHPVLADVFEKVPVNMAMPKAAKSWELRTSTTTMEEAILQFADKQSMLSRSPALQGYVFISAVPFDRDMTDLPTQAGLFAPLMYKMAISNARKLSPYATIGEEGWIDLPGMQLPGDGVLKVTSTGNEFIPEIQRIGNRVRVNLSEHVQTSGMYTIVPDGTPATSKQILALNYNRKESDMQFADANELSEQYRQPAVSIISNPDKNLTTLVAQMSKGTPLWKFCVIFVLVFLAAEIILIRLMP
jgi:hypothetical protein